MSWHTQMTPHNINKEWITFGGPYSDAMSNRPQHKAGKPKAQSKTKRCGKGSIENSD
jgi:hypothetical protein